MPRGEERASHGKPCAFVRRCKPPPLADSASLTEKYQSIYITGFWCTRFVRDQKCPPSKRLAYPRGSNAKPGDWPAHPDSRPSEPVWAARPPAGRSAIHQCRPRSRRSDAHCARRLPAPASVRRPPSPCRLFGCIVAAAVSAPAAAIWVLLVAAWPRPLQCSGAARASASTAGGCWSVASSPGPAGWYPR